MNVHPTVFRCLMRGVLAVVLLAGSFPAQELVAEKTATKKSVPAKNPTPAEKAIAHARTRIERAPKEAAGHTALALALTRRAREIADPSYYEQAASALETSLALSPKNWEARRISVWVLLGQHRFQEALVAARKLNTEAPDDVLVYGFITDACMELGLYDEAEKATQWMLDMRPGNVPGLTRGAYLREVFGDADGAIELLVMAHDRTRTSEREDRAWILTHIGHLYLQTGRVAKAERVLDQALALFPDYHYALAQLARVRTAQGRPADAVSLLEKRHLQAPHPENLRDVAEALHRAGRIEEAKKAGAEFVKGALAESQGSDNCNRELVLFMVDQGIRLDEALALAKKEAAGRRDVHTRDVHAWALSANGAHAQAKVEIEGALSTGIQEAGIFYHAGVIAHRLGDLEGARKHLTRSVELEPASPAGMKAKELFATTEATPK